MNKSNSSKSTLITIAVSVAVSLLLLACGTSKRSAVSRSAGEVSEEFVTRSDIYPEEGRAAYLYTEALKNTLLGGSLDDSRKLLEMALDADSLYDPAHYELAQLSSLNEPDSGLIHSYRAFELDTTNIWYRTQLGRFLIEAGQYDSAMTFFSSLVRLAPDNPENYRLLAALYQQQKRPFEAIAILDSAEHVLGIQPELSEYKRELLVSVKLYNKAITEALTVIENFPHDPENYRTLAELYAMTGKDSLALGAYNQALAISPDDMQTIVSLNEFYKQRGDYPGFFSTTKQIFEYDGLPVKLKTQYFKDMTSSMTFYQNYYFQLNDLISTLAIKYPDDPEVIDLYGTHLIRTGNAEDALKIYKIFIAQNKDKPDIRLFKAIMDIEAYLQRPDSVNKYSSMAIELFPDDTDLYIRKGSVISYFMQDYAGAEKVYRQALKHASTDSLRSVIYGIMGDNSHSAGNDKKCYKYYDKGLRYDSLNSTLLNNYAYYLSEEDRRLEDAEHMAMKANELTENDNPTYLDTHAWVLYKLGRYEEAAAIMKRAISLDVQDNKELLFHYAEILYAMGDKFMASVYWKRALGKGYDENIINERLKLVE